MGTRRTLFSSDSGCYVKAISPTSSTFRALLSETDSLCAFEISKNSGCFSSFLLPLQFRDGCRDLAFCHLDAATLLAKFPLPLDPFAPVGKIIRWMSCRLFTIFSRSSSHCMGGSVH